MTRCPSILRTVLRFGLSIAFAVAITILGLTPAPAAAATYQTQAFYTGHAICGSADLKTGKLLPACGYSKATKTGQAVGKCPAGSFFDIGLWACYTCPSGFKRTGNAVDTQVACVKDIPDERKGAIYVSQHKSCPSGSFGDPRNGGECWKCPSGYGRTMSSVDAWDACGAAFKQARRAEFIDRVCPEGTFGDPNGKCYKCPDGFNRTASAVTANDACIRTEILKPAVKEEALTCKAGEHFDPIDGGTCWSCPEGSTRSVYGVKSNEACEYMEMRWEPTKRATNGLFALPGGPEVAAKVIAQRTRIDAILAKLADSGSQNDREVAEKGWDLVKSTPGDSAVLKSAVYDHVFHLIKNGAKSKPETDLLAYYATYIQQSRQLAAYEMQGAWKSWKLGQQIRKGQRSSTNLMNTFDYGVAPPDMKSLVASAMELGPSAGIILATVAVNAAETSSAALANVSARVATAIRPYTWHQAIARINAKIAQGAIQLGSRSVASTAGAAMSSVMTGPAAIISAMAIIGTISTEQFLAQVKEESVINDAVETAKKPVDLRRLIMTEQGRTEALTNWALMTEKPIEPHPLLWKKMLMEAGAGTSLSEVTIVTDSPSVSAGPAKWQRLKGAARDVAIGSDGTRFHIDTAKGTINLAAKGQDWRVLPGAAARISINGQLAWVVNASGQVFRWQNGKWVRVNGPAATDIGAGAGDNDVWILAGKAEAADQNIFRFTGSGWQQVSGGGARIAVSDGTPWIVNSKGEVWRMQNNKWLRETSAPKAVDIGASKAGVWLLGGSKVNGGYELFKLDGSKWVKQTGAGMSIAVGPDGLPLVANERGEIYVMER